MREPTKRIRGARQGRATRTHAAKSTMRFRPTLFWDVDPRTIDSDKHARYIIARILDFGNDHEVKWMWHQYPKRTIRSVVERSRGLHPQTRALWSLLTAPEH